MSTTKPLNPGTIVKVPKGYDPKINSDDDAWDARPGHYRVEAYVSGADSDVFNDAGEGVAFYWVLPVEENYGNEYAVGASIVERDDSYQPPDPHHYAEFISIQRHILQCRASGPGDLLLKMSDYARDGSCDGLSVADSSHPLLVHKPYGSLEVGQQDDGPAMFSGSPFSTKETGWLRDLAAWLIAEADRRDADA